MSLTAYADTSCKEQVDQAFAKLRDSKSFRLETTIVNPKEGTLKMKADYLLPDKMHQTVMLGTDSVQMEMIVIGKEAWSNEGEGWQPMPEKFAATVANQVKETVAEPPKVSTDYTCAGDKDFEGKHYTLYQGILNQTIAPDAKQTGPRVSAMTEPKQQSIYVDKETGLPARNIVTPLTDPNNRLFDGTFTVVRDLSIEPPKLARN
jgi:hypothetical protein